jgi:hypothetical protein
MYTRRRIDHILVSFLAGQRSFKYLRTYQRVWIACVGVLGAEDTNGLLPPPSTATAATTSSASPMSSTYKNSFSSNVGLPSVASQYLGVKIQACIRPLSRSNSIKIFVPFHRLNSRSHPA